MSPSMIEPGQRLQMQIGGATSVVCAVSEAVVPAAYWVCREEQGGQKRIVAAAVLQPIPAPECPTAVLHPGSTEESTSATPRPSLSPAMPAAIIAA